MKFGGENRAAVAGGVLVFHAGAGGNSLYFGLQREVISIEARSPGFLGGQNYKLDRRAWTQLLLNLQTVNICLYKFANLNL